MKVYIDSFIGSFICFMVFLAIFNYLNVTNPYHVFLSLTLSVFALILFTKINKNKHDKEVTSYKDKKDLMLFCNYLKCEKDSVLLNNLMLILKKAGYMPVKSKNFIVLENEKVYLFFVFKFSLISQDDIISLYKAVPNGFTTAIICSPLAEDASLLCSLLEKKINIVKEETLFNYLKENNLLLDKYLLDLVPKKTKFVILLKESFNRKKSTHFFYVGTIMLVFSLFVFYPIYYLIMGTLFCIYGLLCLFYGKKA